MHLLGRHPSCIERSRALGLQHLDARRVSRTLLGTPAVGAVMLVPCSSCSKSNRLPAARTGDTARCAACKSPLLPLTRSVALRSAEDFDELIRDAKAPVLVDFWAAWCGPCRMVGPELEKIASAKTGKLIVAKVDTEALPDVAARFGIRSIPTMILFRGGKESARLSGAMPASEITAQLRL